MIFTITSRVLCVNHLTMCLLVQCIQAVLVVTHTAPPEFTVQPEQTTVLNSTAASFNCSAKGNPPPTITWLHNGERVTPSDRVTILSNGTLAIDPVTMMDCCVYHCVANNSLGSEESNGAMLIVHCE